MGAREIIGIGRDTSSATRVITIVYIVLAHTLPAQLVRLLKRLESPGAWFLVHVSRRVEDRLYEQIRSGAGEIDNCVMLARHKLYWGDFGHVRATLEGIAEIYRRSLPFDYLVLLTGQDYPIKPRSTIESVLRDSGGKSFLEHSRLPAEGIVDGFDRIRRWHWRRVGRPKGWHLSIPLPRRFPEGFTPYVGSSYWCLERRCVDYVRDFVENEPAFMKFFRHVDVPDESIFQTILLNSPLADEVVNDNQRFIDWTRMPKPAVLGVQDFDNLQASPSLFARKFDSSVDSTVLDLIDEQLLREGPTGRRDGDR